MILVLGNKPGKQTLPNNFTKFSSPQNGDFGRHFNLGTDTIDADRRGTGGRVHCPTPMARSI